MERGTKRIAAAVALELAPAVIINFAVAFAVASILRQAGLGHIAAPASIGSGIAAFLVAWAMLRRIGPADRPFALPAFDQGAVDLTVGEEPELLLTERADPLPHGTRAEDALLLDDVLASIGPESRVVRLFDPAAMPTAGELRERIDRHLHSASTRVAIPDASAELHEALAALRQSLR